MATSKSQKLANRENSLKSTGPTSITGKLTVSKNAIKHGIFSQHLLLDDEDPESYENILSGLVKSLTPEGTLESVFVERVATTLWRQQRLIRAERAITEMQISPESVAEEVGNKVGRGQYSLNPLQPEELEEQSEQLTDTYRAITNEYLPINSSQLTWENFPDMAPNLFRQFEIEAEEMRQSLEECREEYDSPEQYASNFYRYCSNQLQQAEQQPKLQQIAQQIRDRRSIPKHVQRERLTKYQTMLDNELHKNLKALRDTQQWRLHPLNRQSENGFVLEEEAA